MIYFRHKKTKKLYSLVSENFMFKDHEVVTINPEGDICYKCLDVYAWRKGLVLYKAEYDNPDGPFFARTREDFYENFEPIENDELINIIFK